MEKFGTSQLDKALLKLSETESEIFKYISSGMEYSYKLALLPLFLARITQDQEHNLAVTEKYIDELSKLTTEGFYSTQNKRVQLEEFIWLKKSIIESKEWKPRCLELFERLNKKDPAILLQGFTSSRRLKLGVDQYLLLCLLRLEALEESDLSKVQEILKKEISKNKIKTWQDADRVILEFNSLLSLAAIPKFNYFEHWNELTVLKDKTFTISSNQYQIKFFEHASDLMKVGLKMKTCLSIPYKHQEISSGKKFIDAIYEDGKLFSSLSITKKHYFDVVMMRTYNNQEISELVWNEIRKEVKLINANLPQLKIPEKKEFWFLTDLTALTNKHIYPLVVICRRKQYKIRGYIEDLWYNLYYGNSVEKKIAEFISQCR